MIVSGIILSVLGIALLCWLLFTLAVQALPLYIGAIAATLAFQNGAGAVLAIVVGIVAAALSFGATQFVFARVGSSYARVIVALLVMVPAVLAGYHAALGIARIGVPSEPGRQVLAVLGAFVIGCAALLRLTATATRAANTPTTASADFASAATPNDG